MKKSCLMCSMLFMVPVIPQPSSTLAENIQLVL